MHSPARQYVFGPDSEIWRINRFRSGLIFGARAVLLQIARPRIAQGVAEHSDFQHDALGRLRRTLATVNGIAFGTVGEAERLRARMERIHGGVTGTVAPGIAGPRAYSAFEPDLLLWVLATLIDASVLAYEFVREPLPPERRAGFYRDMRRLGSYFGLPEEFGPSGHRAFEDWFAAELEDPLLGSHPLCAEVAAAVVRPPAPPAARVLGIAADFLGIETLPAVIRERLGLASSASTRLRMRALRRLAPPAFRSLPERLTCFPEALRAERALRWV